MDLIVGTGRKSSLVDVLRIAEAELLRRHGGPRGLIAKGQGIEIHALRHGTQGPFEQYALRMPAEGGLVASIREFAEQSGDVSVIESDNQMELRLQAAKDNGAGNALLEQLSGLLHLPVVWHVRGENYRQDRINIESYLQAMQNFHASDLHMFPGSPPVFRIDGRIRHSDQTDSVSADQIFALIKEIGSEHNFRELQENLQCSFTFHQAGLAFVRVSAFIKNGVPHCTMRFLPERIPSFEDLHIPASTMESLAGLHYGLVIVAGMTGSGKSSTVAAIMDWINRHRPCHMLAIEDPIEFVHLNQKSIVSQREIGRDVKTFEEGVRGAMRHDPDVIFIGEMRDSDTIHAAIDAASTGHLVLSTFHANTASEVVGRLVSFFDPIERDLVTLRLRDSLKCVLCQRLAPAKDLGRTPVLEFLFNDSQDLAEFIGEGDTTGIRLAMQQEISESFVFEAYLMKLVKDDVLEWHEAEAYASNVDVLHQMKLGTYVEPSLDSHRAAKEQGRQ